MYMIWNSEYYFQKKSTGSKFLKEIYFSIPLFSELACFDSEHILLYNQ